MAWIKTGTEAMVTARIDINDVDIRTLLQVLVNRGVLLEREAEAIAERRKSNFTAAADDFGIALDEIRRGRRTEALIHIERALGGEFIGRLAG